MGQRHDAVAIARYPARAAAAGDPAAAARPASGSTSEPWASRATARPTTPPPSRRPSTTIAVLYFPTGHYIVQDTIPLKPDTVLIGLHPLHDPVRSARQHARLPGRRRAARGAAGAARADAISMSGIGLFTGGINPRAVGVLWQAGAKSLMDDVRCLGGHGSGSRCDPYNATHSADPDPQKRWDGQYPCLWVTNGGGGTFANHLDAGHLSPRPASTSRTPRRPAMSMRCRSEHHVRRNSSSTASRTGRSTRRRPRRKPAKARKPCRWRSAARGTSPSPTTTPTA